MAHGLKGSLGSIPRSSARRKTGSGGFVPVITQEREAGGSETLLLPTLGSGTCEFGPT